MMRRSAAPGRFSPGEPALSESRLPRAALLAGAAALAAVAAPLLIAWLDPAWLQSSYGRSYARFELLGATGAIALLLVAAGALRGRSGRPWTELLPVVLPLLVGLHFLAITSEFSRKPFDYDCYEYAGRALLAGADPYRHGLLYLYPPLTAQLFAGAYLAVAQAGTLLGLSPAPEAVWDTVFYLYQCAQLGLILLAYRLGVAFAQGVGLGAASANVLVAALLVFDHALLRTLRHGQLNLWILDLALIGILLARRAPLASGACLALAGHLKLYPLILLAPLALTRRWRAAAWTLAGLVAIAFLQSDFGRDWAPWEQYLGFLSSGVRGEIAFRNNSLHSLFFNYFRFAGGDPRGADRAAVDVAVALGSLALLGWFVARLRRRDRACAVPGAGDALARAAYLGHAADALAFALLLSPSVWEHHYVLALPLALWATAVRGRERPFAVGIGIFLVLVMPSLDLFPLGHHRIAGLLLLLLLAPSARLPNSSLAAPLQSRSSQARISASVSSRGSTITARLRGTTLALGRKQST
jgi:hypothetical protein